MSRKRADPRATRGARRRAEAARTAAAPRPSAARDQGAGRRLAIRIGSVILLALGLTVAYAAMTAVTAPRTSPLARASASPGSSAGSAPPSPAGSAVIGGGPLATKLVAILHADPFRAHIDETTVARSTAGTVTVTITAKVVGDVSGRDVALHVMGTGAGPAVDQEVVSLGESTWIRQTGTTTWDVHRRSEASSSIDGLLDTIRLIDDPAELGDAGLDTVDGRSLHHLTAVGTIAYRSPDGADGAYEHLDVWTTDAGIPVLVKGSFAASGTQNALIGNVTIRYSDVGKPVTITAPSGAPTPIP